MIYKLVIAVLAFLMITLPAAAQEATQMTDSMYGSGKIYVVVAVVAVIFVALAVYLAVLDRKISKLEKDSDLNQHTS